MEQMERRIAATLRHLLTAAVLGIACWEPCSAWPSNSTVAIEPADVIAELNPAVTFQSLDWKWSVECAAKSLGILSVPEAGLSLNDLGDTYGPLRFAKVADPARPSKRVLLFRATRSDPLIYGAPRCEATASPTQGGALPMGQTFWFAFGIRLESWTATDDEQIVAQWHHGDGTIAMSPFLAISLVQNAAQLVIRYNNNDPVSKATTTSIRLARSESLPTGRWSFFVVKALISPDGSLGSFVKVWRDGVSISNYHGPVGYRVPLLQPFMKVGHYHWIDASNPWPEQTPVRTVLMRTPVLVRDESGRYSEPGVRAYVMAR